MSNDIPKILVADDNQDLRRNTADILELHGYQVYLASNGQEALRLAKKEKFDFILMDIKMPLMNGIAALAEIRLIQPDVPIVMTTAFAVEKLIAKAQRKNTFNVLKKPIDFEKLIALIEANRRQEASI